MATNPTLHRRSLDHEAGIELPFSKINDPGTYLSNWSGHLIRIPSEAVKAGHSPILEILGKDTMTVTKLSSDPFLCISKARMIAADLDLQVNF